MSQQHSGGTRVKIQLWNKQLFCPLTHIPNCELHQKEKQQMLESEEFEWNIPAKHPIRIVMPVKHQIRTVKPAKHSIKIER